MKPTLDNVVPVLSVGSYEETVSHYVEWLGFKVDWEYREEQLPFVISITRDGFSFMLANIKEKPSRVIEITKGSCSSRYSQSTLNPNHST